MPSRGLSLRHPRKNHISLRETQGFNSLKQHRQKPVAREWNTGRKRLAAATTCFNTVFIGLIAGIYAGEVPKIQYVLVDQSHRVILGNVLLYCGLALTTLLFWPLPLLHGRKPYTLISFALMLPLQFPQAISIGAYRDASAVSYRVGLLFPRVLTGMAMGFANINLLPTLFDLFGASLMSEKPHGELVIMDDVRRQGGGVGLWLGIWSFCFLAALPIGFTIGAGIIARQEPAWGFYVVVVLLAFFLLVNVLAPETRRAPFRRTVGRYYDGNMDTYKHRVARGEVKLHISNDGPQWWWQECWAGIILIKQMVVQRGFFVLMCYMGWIYAQVVLVSLVSPGKTYRLSCYCFTNLAFQLLGALLSRDFHWRSQYVGLANLSLAIGAFLAIPLAQANVFSRSRTQPQRTDSMTFQRSVTWTSHLLRRCLFTLALPFAGLSYTLSSPGPPVAWPVPVIMAAILAFLSTLALAECIGLLMETFDTCDLQPGVNSRHRLQSLGSGTCRRRTNYSSFPRVCAGWFAAQSFGFLLAAASTGVSGTISRALGAQRTTAIVAGILLGITLLLLCVLWRYREVQVVPDVPLGSAEDMRHRDGDGYSDPYWKPVIIGNPSGKVRRMNMLELGSLSRWTEIQKLNNLIRG
ncbi:hypothetical protein K431DRAFT_104726 [Polychaeton citri CBS 116435]|uniref:MFS general substrate transporter n=1 Tax=Polychaeton citri CBS 116435 TaxID=1314669 RepID=A0A9P4UPA9_9PEZI|nr:hypothetical protein K431DRAFT_104726 [Polychaeton citri CBS 116435]